MTDREKLIDILEQAGTMRQFPGSLARILMENGVTFRPIVPGHTDQYNIAEMAYKNGYEDGKPKWIPVTERLPERGQEVIVYSGDILEPTVFAYHFWNKDFASWAHITHWMPLPEAPIEERK